MTTIRSPLLSLLFVLGLTSLAFGEPAKPRYNLSTMTAEEVDRTVSGKTRYDFDIAPDDGVIDATGKLIPASELPAYLQTNALEREAFVFLWIRPDSAALATLAPTVKPFGDYGLTQIVVRHRPEAITQNRTTGDKRFATVRAELLQILESDQKYRRQLDAAGRAGTPDFPGKAELIQQLREADAANLVKVEAILATHGWLGPDDVGRDASGALFLVIQHADLAVQKKYLPMMRDAVKAGQARGASLALLEDRIALREGRPQTYGSQLRSEAGGPLFVQATDDPDRLDARRASVGLPPMADYLKNWNLPWDLEAYKEQLPQLLEKLAAQPAASSRAASMIEK